MTKRRTELGAWGEEVAVEHLQQRGWTVLDRNWRCRAGEIDLVVSRPIRRGRGRAQLVAFVEVKTRRGGGLSPKHSVTAAKRRRLVRLARWYLKDLGWKAVVGRFDVVEVIWRSADPPYVRHLEGAFDASGRPRR